MHPDTDLQESVSENENPAWEGGAHPAGTGKIKFGDMILPKSRRFVKRKGYFS
jgi:hypothetical protein